MTRFRHLKYSAFVFLAINGFGLFACTSVASSIILASPTSSVSPSQPAEKLDIAPSATPVPVEEEETGKNWPAKVEPVFDQFIRAVQTGEKDKIVGMWVEGKMALRVVYQPSSDAGFVSTVDNVATYFLLPYTMAGNYGMLAHNYLAGRFYFDVDVGDIIQLVFGDGVYQDFEVVAIQDYQALQPNSARSEFVDVSTGERLNASNLFRMMYLGDFHTTLQTCIAQGDEDSWGRHFLLAPPI